MLPKGPLGRRMFRKLKVCVSADHAHQAQRPRVLDLSAKRKREIGRREDRR
jgi:large subunit ribosomal protein L13